MHSRELLPQALRGTMCVLSQPPPGICFELGLCMVAVAHCGHGAEAAEPK